MAAILVTRRLSRQATAQMQASHRVSSGRGAAPMGRSELLRRIRAADGLVCFPYDVIDAEAMDAAPGLQAISSFSVGYDHIDVRHARRRGIAVCNTPGVLTAATADLAMALLLDVARNVSRGDRMVRAGRWKAALGPQELAGTDLEGTTLGIVGMGRIGSQVARRASSFGINVIYCSRHRISAAAEKRLKAKYTTLGRLLRTSDFVSLHVPHTAQTSRMINAKAISMMRRGAYLINTSRGAIVDEKALASALKSGRLAGAGLDVFECEPLGAKSRLRNLENAVLAPHIGSATVQTRRRMEDVAVKNILLALSGKRPLHRV